MIPSSDAIPAPVSGVTGKFRSDIQGLRAVAVALVVIFHMFPTAVTGGYVGVDVFFVVSGFLITGLLIRRAERDGRVDFKDFYIRRARRLLPAACAALVVSGLACFFILPRSLWSGTAREIVASAFYFENILLYFQGRDYLTSETVPSPFQHYWSLSIEEQFYVLWPIVIAFGLWLSRVLKWSLRGVLLALLGVGTALSLYQSAVVSPRDPGAYFLTTTRLWELALGGLLALAMPYLRLPSALVLGLRWVGLAAILYAGIVFTKATVFPGVAALIPTVGTLALLLPDSQKSLDPGRLLSLRPMNYLGDISYSLYLWHWPVLVLGGYLVGGTLAGAALAGAFVLMMALSHVSKFYLEDRFRHARPGPGRGARAVGLSALFLGASTAAAAALYWPSMQSQTLPESVDLGVYPGALALNPAAPEVATQPFIPRGNAALTDVPVLYADQCQVPFDSDEPRPCVYGNPDGPVTIALVGDSHSAQYLPTLQALAERRDLRIVTHTKSSCAFIDALIYRDGLPYESCLQWNRAVSDALLELKPDLVITAKFSSTSLVNIPSGTSNDDAVADALVRSWRPLLSANIPVLALSHTPRFEQSIPDCVSSPGRLPADCAVSRSEALSRPDHPAMAAARLPSANFADVNAYLCTEQSCPPVIGNVLVYRDAHHITATYARSMSTLLQPHIERAIGRDIPEMTKVSETVGLPADLVDAVPGLPDYAGAMSLRMPDATKSVGDARPEASRLRGDLPSVFVDGCYGPSSGNDVVRCEYGRSQSDAVKTLAIVGDAGMASWMPALELYAQARDVRIVTYLKSGCAFSTTVPYGNGRPNLACRSWSDEVAAALGDDAPDMLLISVHPTLISADTQEGEGGKHALARGIAERVDALAADTPVVALAQLPIPDAFPAMCLEATAPEGLGSPCATPRSVALKRQDSLAIASRLSGRIQLVDLNNSICRNDVCQAVEGRVSVYNGGPDVTATYMRTLMPVLGLELDSRLGIAPASQ